MTARKNLLILGIVILAFSGLALTVYLKVSKNLVKVDEDQFAPPGCPLHEYAVRVPDVYDALGLYLGVQVQENTLSGYLHGPALDQDIEKYMQGPSRPIDLYKRYMVAREQGTALDTYVWSFATAFQASSEYQREVQQYDQTKLGQNMPDRTATFPGIVTEHRAYHYISGGQGTDREWTILSHDSNLLYIIYARLPTGATRADLEAALKSWSERVAKLKTGTTPLCNVAGRSN